MKRINRQSSRAQNQTSSWKWRENIKKHSLNTYAEKRTTEKRDAVPWSFVRLREYSLQWTFKSTSFKEPYQHLNFFPYYSLDFAEPLSHPDSPHIFLLPSTKLVSALQPEVVSTFGTFPYWFFFFCLFTSALAGLACKTAIWALILMLLLKAPTKLFLAWRLVISFGNK